MLNIQSISKTYRDHTALDSIDFHVDPGEIVGFLGPNGAGKTTAMKILLGLTRQDSGTAEVAGQPYREIVNPGTIVGSLLGTECFHPGRTGRETLRLAALTMGVPKSRVPVVCEQVGLSRAETRRRVGAYSLGMKQRLGLALALLGRPSALVLDEPSNGLDPQGQHWLGELLTDLKQSGCAVLLSSHQLSAVSRIADRVVMIAKGRIVADEKMSSLQARADDVEELYFRLTSGADRATAA